MNNLNNMTPQEIADTCEATAALLEGNWTRGTWYDKSTETYCIEGALAAALNLDVGLVADGAQERQLLRNCPVYAAVMKTITDQITASGNLYADDKIRLISDDGLPLWNDADDREEQDVLDVLHTTAKRVLGVGPDDA
jgi:hypothetical protein